MKRKLYMLVLFMFAFYLGDAQSNIITTTTIVKCF